MNGVEEIPVTTMDVYSWIRRRMSKHEKNILPSSSWQNDYHSKQNPEEEKYGITEELIEFVKSFSLDTFKNFSLPDEEQGNETSERVRRDLSQWQERHAMLILAKVKELSQLRFRLCPRYLKERLFWRIYFMLVRSYIAEYELQAIRVAKLQQMALDWGSVADKSAIEVEMSEAKMTTVSAATSEHC